MHPHLLKHIIEGSVVWTIFALAAGLFIVRIVGFPQTEIPEEDNESTLWLDSDDDGSGLEPHRR